MLSKLSQSVSQSGEDLQFCGFVKFLFLVYRRSRVFLLVATADMACLSLDEVNGSFKRFVYVYFCCFESKWFVWIALVHPSHSYYD